MVKKRATNTEELLRIREARGLRVPVDEGVERAAATGQVDDRIKRVLATLEQNERNTLDATARIGSTLETLRSFSYLDKEEFQRISINQNLDSTLALIPPQTSGRARLEKHYDDVPEIQCYAVRLNQVFMAFLTNAFEAIDVRGRSPSPPELTGVESLSSSPTPVGAFPLISSTKSSTSVYTPRNRASPRVSASPLLTASSSSMAAR